jgi:hypothetical protein
MIAKMTGSIQTSKIEKEPEATCIYKRLKLDYTYGFGRIYTEEDRSREG